MPRGWEQAHVGSDLGDHGLGGSRFDWRCSRISVRKATTAEKQELAETITAYCVEMRRR